ncbi:hypothetical protein B0I37DRAFT_443764 [Chaetomium sp. MPI-CAGE-AT-0009]|nr:hypothetical protein B0I37DRAFT_443764 [Chaetomium sp. MPI-CAGE-AT-0009]
MKFTLSLLLLAPLALADTLPEREATADAVAAGASGSDIPKGDGLKASALYCPVGYPWYCPYGFCCPGQKCCSLECCTDAATYCSYGRCYRLLVIGYVWFPGGNAAVEANRETGGMKLS